MPARVPPPPIRINLRTCDLRRDPATCRDQGTVYSAPQFLGVVPDNPDELTKDKARKAARDFILTFTRDSVFPYRCGVLGVYGSRRS